MEQTPNEYEVFQGVNVLWLDAKKRHACMKTFITKRSSFRRLSLLYKPS